MPGEQAVRPSEIRLAAGTSEETVQGVARQPAGALQVGGQQVRVAEIIEGLSRVLCARRLDKVCGRLELVQRARDASSNSLASGRLDP